MRSGRPFRDDGSRGRGSRRAVVSATVLSLGLALVVAVAGRLAEGVGQHRLPRVVPRLVPTDIRFFVDPESSSAVWVAGHSSDRRAALIDRRVASQPQAVWFTAASPGAVQQAVARTTTEAAIRHKLPVLVMYAIPHRDCAGRSAGGASSVAEYRRWVDGFSNGLGSASAWVVLEPDALMQVGCLTARQRSARFQAVTYAARTLHQRNAPARIYYDMGNSWHSAADTASLLRRAHVSRYGDGIALNVANLNRTDDEVRFGMDVIRTLGDPKLRMVVDTARNGDGRNVRYGTCDPVDSRLGAPPTSRTGDAWVDGFLWVKPPGQSDGCDARLGTFLADEAHRLAARDTGRGRPRADHSRPDIGSHAFW